MDAMQKKKLFITLILLAVFLIAVIISLPGCKKQSVSEDAEIILAAGRDLSPGYKDPYFSTVILKTWEPLIAISDDGDIEPKLALSWDSNESRTEWLFHLRKGVTFQDGVPFNAKAAVENFKRYSHMGYRPSSFYGFAIERVYPGLLKAEAVDEYVLKLTFKRPVPMLIYRMAGWGSAMFSPHCFNADTGDFVSTAMGTGPFYIADRKDNEYTVLKRYDNYYGEKAKAKSVRIKVIPSPETRYSAMKSGEVHGVIDLGGLTPILARELVKDERFACNAAKSTISHYLTLNGRRFPFSDERMRIALNLAIDREKIVKHYFCGFGTPTMSFLNSTNPFTKVYPPYTDMEKAKKLASDVLQGRRQKVKFLLHQYGVSRYPYKIISEFIQAELRPLGLDVEIVMVDNQASRKTMQRGEFDMSIGTRGLPNLDPTWLLHEFFSAEGGMNKSSSFGYYNPVIENCFAQLDYTYPIPERARLYDTIIRQLLIHPAVVPLLEDTNLAVYDKRLGGYKAITYGITLDKVHWIRKDEAGQ